MNRWIRSSRTLLCTGVWATSILLMLSFAVVMEASPAGDEVAPSAEAREPGPAGCARHGGTGCCGRMGRGDGQASPKGGGYGPGSSHHENIQALLDWHDKIERDVTLIEGGVETLTISDDPQVTATLRVHVREMQKRMESGQGLRHWDPLFVELFRHHDKIRMEIQDVPGGVRVRETSSDADVVALIRQHAVRGVSEFVAQGHPRASQPTPLPDEYVASSDEGLAHGCMAAAATEREPAQR